MIKNFKILYGGRCFHPERTVKKGGSFKDMEFPALFFYIELESGEKILFDTGYSETFYEATKKFPFWIYRKLTKVDTTNSEIDKINPNEIDYIFISHFHPDHIGNLNLFKNSKYICHSTAYETVKNLKGFRALKAGFLKQHIPSDFEERVIYYDKRYNKSNNEDLSGFDEVFELFNDEIFVISMEGHHIGHSGLYFKYKEYKILLIADAVWTRVEYEELNFLGGFAKFVIKDYKNYVKTIKSINKTFNKLENIIVIPSHSNKIYEEVKTNADFI